MSIFNEILTNSLKHAFKEGEAGKIWIKMKKKGDDIKLKLADNSGGFPDNF
jgi:two-component sensor histidine kinase